MFKIKDGVSFNDGYPNLTDAGTVLQVNTADGYIRIGSSNASYAHITTDRSKFYFNQKLVVDSGIVQSYDEDLTLNRTGSTTARVRVTSGRSYSDQPFEVQDNGGASPILRVSTDDGSPWSMALHRVDYSRDSRVFYHNYSDIGHAWIFEDQPAWYDGGSVTKLSVEKYTAPRYKQTVQLAKDTYKRVARIEGDQLASTVRVSVTGTTSSVVVAQIADLIVNHAGDIQINVQSGDYSPLHWKIISSSGEDFDLYLKYTTGSGTTLDLHVEIYPLNSETVTFEPTATAYTTTTLEKQVGTGKVVFAQSSGDVDIETDGNITANNYYINGTQWFDGSTTHLRSDNHFQFLTDAGNAQYGKFRGLQVSSTYAGTVPDQGILFGSDTQLYRYAANKLAIGADDMLVINPGSGDYSGNQTGVVNKSFQVHTSYNSDGSQWIGSANLDGNWLDGTSGADTQYGWLWGYQNNIRAGLIYDHRSTERMALWSSYGRIDFMTANSVDANAVPIDSNVNARMTIKPGGNVGIGTTNPIEKLDVHGGVKVTSTASDNHGFVLSADGTRANASVGHTTTYKEGIFWHTNDDYSIAHQAGSWQNSTGYQQLEINWPTGIVLDTEAQGTYSKSYVRVNQLLSIGGNVGIGTTNPSMKLDVRGASRIATNTSINPDSYNNSVVAGAISDGSWGVSSAIGGKSGTGHTWAIGTNGQNLYHGYGDGANGDSLVTYLRVSPGRDVMIKESSTGRVIVGRTGVYSIPNSVFQVNAGNVDIVDSDNNRAYRFYQGTAFRGGFGTGAWAGASGSTTTGVSAYATGGDFTIHHNSGTPSARFSNEGHFGLERGDAASNVSNGYPKIVYPNVHWSSSGNPSTGAIKIRTPGNLSNYDMCHIVLTVYEYTSDAASTIIIGGHNWTSGANSANTGWHNVNCQVIGSFNKPIYLTQDANDRYIVLGDNTSTWTYGMVSVMRVHGASFYPAAIDWVGDWHIEQTTSATYTWSTSNLNSVSSITLRTPGAFTFAHNSGSGMDIGRARDDNMYISVATTGDAGVVLKDSAGSFRSQWYGDNGTNYGFLSSEWGSWDIKKTISGKLYLNNSSTYYLQPESINHVNEIRTRAMVRATGWYGSASSDETGLGLEIGVSSSQPWIYAYNRSASTTGSINVGATEFRIQGGLSAGSTNKWHVESKASTFVGGSFNSAINNSSTTLKLFPSSDSRSVGDYNTGIQFMHLDPDNSTWGSSYQGGQAWIGLQLYDTPGQERDSLVFATNASSTAGSFPTERARIEPDGQSVFSAPMKILGGTYNSNTDGTLWVQKDNNNDWGIIIKADSGSTDYGLDVRMGASANYGIRLTGSGEKFRVNGAGQVRAPIYYDINDTDFFVDPANNSRVQHIEGHQDYTFRGYTNAANEWSQSTNMATSISGNGAGDYSWYMVAQNNTWSQGAISKARFRRANGLTLDYEAFMDQPNSGNVHYMVGFISGSSGSYSYSQNPANLTYHNSNEIRTYTNGSNTGTDYTFDSRGAYWRFKIVLKGQGANHYVYRNYKWNLIKSIDTNDGEWVRVLISAYNNRMYFRNMRVYYTPDMPSSITIFNSAGTAVNTVHSN